VGSPAPDGARVRGRQTRRRKQGIGTIRGRVVSTRDRANTPKPSLRPSPHVCGVTNATRLSSPTVASRRRGTRPLPMGRGTGPPGAREQEGDTGHRCASSECGFLSRPDPLLNRDDGRGWHGGGGGGRSEGSRSLGQTKLGPDHRAWFFYIYICVPAAYMRSLLRLIPSSGTTSLDRKPLFLLSSFRKERDGGRSERL
jgi:hypothetical protein